MVDCSTNKPDTLTCGCTLTGYYVTCTKSSNLSVIDTPTLRLAGNGGGSL